jgi:hypothetical protein
MVVITISTYTEPPQPIAAVEEPQKPQETAENEEPEAFAKLLAKLLQKTEADSEAAGAPQDVFSECEIDALIGEESETGKKLNLFAPVQETEPALQEELSETDIPEGLLGFLMSAEHLLTRSNAQPEGGEDAGSQAELSNVEIADRFADIETDEAFPLLLDTAETDFAAQVAASASAGDLQESFSDKTGGKKDRAQFENESVQSLSSADSRKDELASLRTAPEKETRSRLEEARSRSRRDRVTFEVSDLRTPEGTEKLKNAQMRFNAGADITNGRMQQAPLNEITLELRLPSQSQNPQTTWEVKAPNALENMLPRELHQNFNAANVRHASMALRDGGEGTIRLALKPESLGNVKIHLEMTENKITGRIVVESEEALNAFRKEISSLEQAFRDSGFASADLNLSLTAGDSGTEWQEQEANSFTARTAALRYDGDNAQEDSLPLVDVYFGRRAGTVNMLA